MTEPLVSIIIPVYNSARYVADAIRSAVEQTYPNKEIIIVDDGSDDDSLFIAQSFESDFVTVLSQINSGASAARNAGLRRAGGTYIQFLDADDILSADKISLQIQALKGTDDIMAVSSTVYFADGTLKELYEPLPCKDRFLYTTGNPVEFMINLWGGNDFNASMVQTNAWLTPRKLIDTFGCWDETLTVDDDGEFFARIVLNSKGIIKTSGINYYRKYPLSANNLSACKNESNLESWCRSIILKKQHLFERDISDNAKKAIFKLFTELSVLCYCDAPAVYNCITNELNLLPPYKCKVVIGGPRINTIANIFGWRLTKRIQNLYYYITT